MTKDDPNETPGPPRPRRRFRRARLGLWMVLALVFAGALGGFGWLSYSGQVVSAPDWLTARLVARVNDRLPGGRVSLGRLQLRVGRDGRPRVRLGNLGIFDAGGAEVARLNDVGVQFSPAALLRGRFEPQSVDLTGAQMTLRRRIDGRFDISLGAGATTTTTLPGMLDRADEAMQQPALARLERLGATELTITLEDARSGRLWQITDGELGLKRGDRGLDLTVNFDVFNQTEELAVTTIGLRTDFASSRASIGTTFSNAAARDIALQSPVLSFLGVLDAPISGALRAELDDDGALETLAGTLQIGAGALQPTPETRPVAFNAAKAYFEFFPAERKIAFSEINLSSETATVTARGQAYLRDFEAGWPSTFLGQFAFSDIKAHPADYYREPITFSQGAADIRLRLKPFSVEVGQFVLGSGDEKLVARGRLDAVPGGWRASTDMKVARIANQRLLALWPVSMIPRTRDWLERNVHAATLRDVTGAIRIAPGSAPQLSLGWNFSGTNMHYIPAQPPIEDARGYASIDGNALTLVVEGGSVTPPRGGAIDMAGTTFSIPDLGERPARAQVRLKGRSSTTAVLSLLDEPPFRVLKNTDFGPEISDGRAEFAASVDFALKKRITFEDVTWSATGTLDGVRSQKLVPGYVLTSERLQLRADNRAIEISGPLRIGAVSAEVLWRQPLSPGSTGASRVTGTVELGPDFVREFHIGLPRGSVSGKGRGRFEIRLARGEAPKFTLGSDLNRIGLRLDAIGWRKPRNAVGRLTVEGRLGAIARIDLLELSASGLRLTGGRVALDDHANLDVASFARLRVGGWLDAPVTLRGRGPGKAPAVEVDGGTIDIRKTSFAQGGGAGGPDAGGDAGPITLNPDQVIISEGMRLTDFTGVFSTAGGFNGGFTARMNGQTPLSGTLVPDRNGTAVRITSDNAGGVMRAAGIVEYANKGRMDLTLKPLPAPGEYQGVLQIDKTKVINAPGLTDLLSAISIVGLLDQMSGEGISFDDVQARFRLTPKKVFLQESSAVGPSLGISLDGVYDLASGTMDMQGVISPVWFLNGIGQLVSKRGEGLFGFTFTLKGTNEEPQVSVNPLSILTPGAFREIFRAPPPRPAESQPDAQPDAQPGQ